LDYVTVLCHKTITQISLIFTPQDTIYYGFPDSLQENPGLYFNYLKTATFQNVFDLLFTNFPIRLSHCTKCQALFGS